MRRIIFLLMVLVFFLNTSIYAQIPENPIITPENADQVVELTMLGRGWITDVAYSPDGQTILIASSIGIWVYDVDDLDIPIRLLRGHTGRIDSIVYSSDGRTFATLSNDDTVRIWDAETQETVYVLEQLEEHDDYLTAIAYSSDNRMLAIALSEGIAGTGIVQIWSAETGEILRVLEGHITNVESVAFSPDGYKLASSSWDHTIRIWDIETGETLQILEAGEKLERPLVEADSVNDVIFNYDGSKLVSASDDKIVRIWDIETGEILQEFAGHTKSINRVVYSPDGQEIASASWDNTIRIWDAETGETIHIIEGMNISRALAYSPDGRTIATGREFWDAETGELRHVLQGYEAVGANVVYSPDGNILASWAGSKIFIWDAKTGLLLKQFEGTERVDALIFSPDGNMLVSAGWYDTIRIWDIDTGEILQSINISYGYLAFSPDSQTLAIGAGEIVYLFDVQSSTSREINLPEMYRGGVSSIDFSPDGQSILIITIEVGGVETNRIWDLETLELSRVLTGYTDSIESATYSPDGTMVAGGAWNGKIHIWDVETGQMLYTLEGISRVIRSIAYSPDGRMIISGNDDGTIEMWDIEAREMVNILHEHTGGLATLAFSPDGCFIASGSYDGTVRIWGVPIDE